MRHSNPLWLTLPMTNQINHSQQGFTLLEVLLAVAITALIGIGASQLLSSISNTSITTNERALQLRTIQRMDLWVKRDLWQVAGRSVLDENGTYRQPITNDSDFLLEFTHSGQANSALSSVRRSNLQRVAYAVRSHDSDYCKDAVKKTDDEETTGNCLVRLFWPVLDLAPSSEGPLVQVLIDNIIDANVFFAGQALDLANSANNIVTQGWEEDWPSPFMSPDMISDLAKVKLVYSVGKLGEIERIYEVPRYAFIRE